MNVKTYCAFRFEDENPKDFHATHIYLGSISEKSFSEVCRIVSSFFADRPGIFQLHWRNNSGHGPGADPDHHHGLRPLPQNV